VGKLGSLLKILERSTKKTRHKIIIQMRCLR
jgi:hypothetical protein